MQGYHDMRDNDETPKWMVYVAILGLGVFIGMLGARVISLLAA